MKPTKKKGLRALSPKVSFKEEPAGRETLAAIARDRGNAGLRLQNATQHYGDRISNAPGAMSPKVARAIDSAPDISVSYEPFASGLPPAGGQEDEGHETPPSLASVPSANEPSEVKLDLASIPIEQVHHFVVACPPEMLESKGIREALVLNRLLRQIPACAADDILRLEVKQGELPNTSILYVWVRVH